MSFAGSMFAASRLLPASLRFAACVGAACALMSAAATAQGKDELWDITTRIEMAGMPMQMPAQSHRMCVEKGNDAGLVPKNDNGNCQVTDHKRTGNKFTFTVVCTGKDAMTGKGEMTYAADSYEGRIQMKGKSGGESFDMTQTMSGKKVGNCTSTVRQDVAKAQAQAEQGLAQSCDIAMKQYLWQSFEAGAACAAQRTEFCAAVTRGAMAASEPAGYVKARKETMLADAMGKCGKDFAVVTSAACGKGVDTRNWEFVGSGYCDDNVRALGASQCKGRSFTGMGGMVPVCTRYASLMRSDGAPAAGTAAAAPSAQPGQAAQPTDAISDSVNRLKKLLPF